MYTCDIIHTICADTFALCHHAPCSFSHNERVVSHSSRETLTLGIRTLRNPDAFERLLDDSSQSRRDSILSLDTNNAAAGTTAATNVTVTLVCPVLISRGNKRWSFPRLSRTWTLHGRVFDIVTRIPRFRSWLPIQWVLDARFVRITYVYIYIYIWQICEINYFVRK